MKPLIKIHRFWQDKNQTSGTCTVIGEDGFPMFTALTLERGWMNNQNMISCIPAGCYPVRLEYSPHFDKMLWEIKKVPNRSECKFHTANYRLQLNGCIALGLRYKLLNNDSYLDVTNSANTMRAFHFVLRNYTEAILIITTELNIK